MTIAVIEDKVSVVGKVIAGASDKSASKTPVKARQKAPESVRKSADELHAEAVQSHYARQHAVAGGAGGA